MSNEDNSSDIDVSSTSDGIVIPRLVRFWIILPVYISSIICSLFVLYHLIANRTSRHALHNHIIILLLIINFIVQLTNIPWILYYFHTENVLVQTPLFCLTWIFVDEALYITTTLLFAWATIERHILIFHDRLLATKSKLIIFHYLPVIILLLYCVSYNTIVIIFPPCENTFDYTKFVCGHPLCYYETHAMAIWDIVANDIVPTIVIIFSSVALLGRVLYQKQRMRQPTRWRNYRKMTIQLLSISLLYLIIYIPKMLMEFVYLCGVSEDVGADFIVHAKFFSYYGNFLLPFVCAASLPKLKTKLKKICLCWERQPRAIRPQTIPTPDRQIMNR